MIYTVTLNPTIDRTMHFPRLAIGELNRATSSRIDLSGKGVNVSVALRIFGVETTLLGIVGGRVRAYVGGGPARAGVHLRLLRCGGRDALQRHRDR